MHNRLRAMNVYLVRPLSEESFAPYGRVFERPNSDPLAETAAFSYWSDISKYVIEGETEIGWCIVRRTESADWFERHHRTPEVLIPVDSAVALPVMGEDQSVEVFRVDVGQAVILNQSAWHSACIPLESAEAGYFVIFRRGTPSEDVEKTSVAAFSIGDNTSDMS
jgi:ureidoglycolate hydrolase